MQRAAAWLLKLPWNVCRIVAAVVTTQVYSVFLACRYMLARPVSYLAMVAIGLAVMALIVVWSIMNGFLGETRAVIRGTTADIVVTVFQDKDRPIPRELTEGVAARHPAVRGACSRLVRPAIFKAFGDSQLNRGLGSSLFAEANMVLVLGVEPEDELGVTELDSYLSENVDQERLAVDDPRHPFRIHRAQIQDRRLMMSAPPTVLMGERLMNQLGLRKGEAIDLVTLPESADPFEEGLRASSETFVIAGAFSTGHHENDSNHILMSRDDFRRWTGTSHEASEIYVSLDAEHEFELAEVRDELQAEYRRFGLNCRVESWMDRHAILLGAVQNERNILAIVLGLFVLLTCTITFSMLTMMVQEKVRDIGILSAMGASPEGVGAVFALCGTFISALGGLLGLLWGWLLAVNANNIKDWLEDSFGIEIFDKTVYAFTEIPVMIDHRLNLTIAGTTVLFAVIICTIPALRAGRMNPVEALRHE